MRARPEPGDGTTRPRHVPQRRCLGCGARRAKGELLRFTAVPTATGHALARDDACRLPGRGLYVCPGGDCFARAVARRAFQRGARVGGPLEVDEAAGDVRI